jgi:hypothetical protein
MQEAIPAIVASRVSNLARRDQPFRATFAAAEAVS